MTRYLFEHFAVMFGAATGALAARGKRIDLFGVIVLGLVAAVGGGTLRDLLLQKSVFWIEDASFVVTGATAALIAFVLFRYVSPPTQTLQIIDAVSLAFVTMLGTAKTWQFGHAWPVCLVLGVTTGVAGGMIRDVLCGEVPLVFRAHIDLYATAALAGATVYLMVTAVGGGSPANLISGAVLIFALRLAALKWHLRLPEFDTQESSE